MRLEALRRRMSNQTLPALPREPEVVGHLNACSLVDLHGFPVISCALKYHICNVYRSIKFNPSYC